MHGPLLIDFLLVAAGMWAGTRGVGSSQVGPDCHRRICGIGFLMLAVLTMAAMPVRNAVATKNALASVMNASAVLIFVFSKEAHWRASALIAIGALAGGLFGTWLLGRLNEKLLRFIVVIIGCVLTGSLFARGL